jgi:hypothetical protein
MSYTKCQALRLAFLFLPLKVGRQLQRHREQAHSYI